MPISGVLLTCAPERLDEIRRSIKERERSAVRERRENMLVVVTDTQTLDEDRSEVEGLARLDGVLASHVVFSNIEDALEASQ